MKNLCALSVVAVMALATTVSAGEKDLKSGLEPGESHGAFYVTKCAGAKDDGVKEGKNLCYRCKNGQRPQVIVFTRSSDPKVTELVKQLDAAINKNEEAQLRAFVNVMGDSKEDATDAANSLADKSSAANIPFVVPNEFENGPDNYGINPDADVTILVASQRSVKANHAVAKAADLDIKAVLASVQKVVE